ncbi:hypothetical protein HETIRDRAFT_322551 [Heterobasidion irregulare TC 32-1]|uniref:Bromodomain associated domain-containing protein n=1 Tax=Heterobasidion irregulare (strain TC 32-1) TaxID=747525 RepID=W4K2C5_HETIT|nr:uncharacterized protein HETIRDRAFT_322551 [Heterobasidion irregulare TC 32-1]ETW79874.1 hypothetical protein HETIRDRAFT_322551 [Heterobasidion irregulare TC 32-1]
MDSNAFKLLESVTLKTLHAHSFSRSSTQASLVLTDLLSRYIALLSTTCAQYAQHAGRTNLTARDAIRALDELGIDVEELNEYCSHEGEELARYAGHSTKRLEDLNDFKGQSSQEEEEDGESPVPYDTNVDMDDVVESAMDMVNGEAETSKLERLPPLQRIATPVSPRTTPHTPPLPLSPVSNPSSPARKRPRTNNWHPPSHIPHFLPPFPNDRSSPEPEPLALPPAAEASSSVLPPTIKSERPASPPRHSSSAQGDYVTAVPYSLSALSSTPEWHLPHAPSLNTPQFSNPSFSRLPVPQVQPSLLAAYHHILTHPPPANPNAANPSRHRVAMQFLHQVQRNPRWEPVATLYASNVPNAPTVAAIGPTYPVPIGTEPPTFDEKKDDENSKKSNLPAMLGRPVGAPDRLTSLVSYQDSRISELARAVLSAPLQKRTMRLSHPGVLKRGSEQLIYGNGVSAVWNSSPMPAPVAPTPTVGKGKEALANGLANGKGAGKEKALPDARMYATWEYDQKSFKEPLAIPRRARQASIQSNLSSVSAVGRARSESRIG